MCLSVCVSGFSYFYSFDTITQNLHQNIPQPLCGVCFFFFKNSKVDFLSVSTCFSGHVSWDSCVIHQSKFLFTPVSISVSSQNQSKASPIKCQVGFNLSCVFYVDNVILLSY